MEFRVLGRLEVVRRGAAINLGGRAQRSVLAMLVLNANRVVSLDRMVDDLWPEGPPPGGQGTIQAYISRIRRLLEPDRRAGAPASVLLTQAPGYVLRVDPGSVDAARFDVLAEQGRARLAAGDPEDALRLLDGALGLWRGPVLADLTGAPFVAPEVARLEECRLAAAEDRLDACLALGRHAAVVAELETLVRAHPLRERLAGQLIVALYRSGRQAEALRAYQDTRRLLGEELGIDPGPALKALEQAVLLQDPDLDWHPPAAAAARPAPVSPSRAAVPDQPDDGPTLPTGTVTFLLADVDRSARLWADHPAVAERTLARLGELVAKAVARRAGAATPGDADAHLCVFGSARDAVDAAIELQLALRDDPSLEPVNTAVRVAIHTGEVLLQGDRYQGLSMHLLRRLRDLAHGGQILASVRSADLVSDRLPAGAVLRPLGAHHLPDFEQAEQVFQVCSPGLEDDFPALRGLAVSTHNLPAALTSFVGRGREVLEVTRLIGSERLVTLVGAGGVGKTRLALRVAHERLDAHGDGVWLIDLAPLAEPTLVVETVGDALGVAGQAGRSLLDSLVEHLRQRDVLLVLDNCEHLAGACAALMGELLPAAPRLRVLATSREPLGVDGEVAWRVPSLPAPAAGEAHSLEELIGCESVQLFVERAQAARPGLSLEESDAPALAVVCGRLDGVPLALELAAARVSVLGVAQIAARLDDRFRLLTSPRRTGLPRHQTLRATLDWSYDLLEPAEQLLLRRLSVFAGGFSLEAAEAVAAGPGIDEAEVLNLLGQLVAKSLVTMSCPPGGVARYGLLETIRQYATEKLVAAGEADGAARRHRDFYLTLAESSEDEATFGEDGRLLLDRLETEHDNFRAALDWSLRKDPDGDDGLRLVHALYPLWNVRGHDREGRAWMEALLAASTAPRAMQSAVARRAGALAATDDLEAAARLFDLALELARRSGDRQHLGRALLSLGDLDLLRGNLEEARARLEESYAIATELGDDLFVAESLLWLGWVALSQGRYEEARAWAEACRTQGGGWYFAVRSLKLLGTIERDQGRYEAARRCFLECRDKTDAAGDREHAAAARDGLASVAAADGRPVEAQVFYEEARALSDRLPPMVRTGTLGGLGELAAEAGDRHSAHLLLHEELNRARDLGDLFELACVLGQAGRAEALLGDPAAARGFFEESRALSCRIGMPLPLAAALEGLARVEVKSRPDQATRLLAAAASIRTRLGTPLTLSARKLYEVDLEVLRAVLAEEEFCACWVEGEALAREVVHPPGQTSQPE